jgi:ATP-binding cassette subfamily B protein
VVYALSAALQAVVTYWGHALGIGIETDMRRKAFDHLQKLSFSFFDNHKTGHLITHVTKDLEEVGEVAHHGPEDLFIAVMTFIGALVLMVSINWQLALITATVVPFMTWLASRYGARMTSVWRQVFGRVGDFNTRIEESIGGIRVVKAFANEDHERVMFETDNQSYRRTKLEGYRAMASAAPVTLSGMECSCPSWMRLIEVAIPTRT